MMTTELASTTVGQLVRQQPDLARLFERLQIDYCCGGQKTLQQACHERRLDTATVVTLMQAMGHEPIDQPADVNTMSMTQLADHIQTTHHQYLKQELPRLGPLVHRIADRHLDKNPRLNEVVRVFDAMAQEMLDHMAKEERVLFPAIRQLDAQGQAGMNLAAPVSMMEHEHQQTGEALAQLRQLTDDYTTPADACNTYRAVMHSLQQLERDMHQHIHKENNVLFPAALEAAGIGRK